MAESVVAQPPQRFYCHKCNVEIENVNTTEYTCPLCAGGFIEELPSDDRSRSSSSNDDTETPGEFNDRRLNERISSLLMSSIGGGLRSTEDDGDQSANQDGTTAGDQRQRRRGPRRMQEMPNFENIMQEFLISISGGAANNVAGGSAPMFFMGNPGDYAWGREGLDTVITQMLNQMENSGPPPLAKEKIESILRIEIDDEHIEQKLQCSVCWDDFLIMETVRKLPCTHIYHENCIVPWLELHGTCPVCRKAVDKDATEEQAHAMPMGNISNITNRIGNVYRTTFNFFNQGDGEQLDSVASSSTDGPDGNFLSFISSQLQDQSQPDQSSETDSPPQQRRDRRTSSRRDDDGNVEFDCD